MIKLKVKHLTDDDMNYIRLQYGKYPADKMTRNINQIDRSIDYTHYEIETFGATIKIHTDSYEDLIRIVGREIWLSGLMRSAFHSSAVRTFIDVPAVNDGTDTGYEPEEHGVVRFYCEW